jgi:integrase
MSRGNTTTSTDRTSLIIVTSLEYRAIYGRLTSNNPAKERTMASVFKRKSDRGRKLAPWRIKYKDAEGRWRSATGCTDKVKSEQMARALESEAALERQGLCDPKDVRRRGQGFRPFCEHLDEYHAAIKAKNATTRNDGSKHANSTKTYIRWVAEAIAAERIADLTPSAVQGAIARLIDEGRSPRTCNAYITAVKGFTRWLWVDGRTTTDELAHLTKYNEEADRRRVRRPLNAEGLISLFQTAESGPEVSGMSGPDRAMLYRLASGSGFRASELGSLVPESFKLDANPPVIEIQAGYTKNGKTALQIIPAELAEVLRPWVTQRPTGCPVFALPEKTAKMLRSDLEAAGIAYKDAEGGVVDFHALRHTFITLLVGSGASVKVAQVLARHSTPTLTIGRYAHADTADRQSALAAFPSLVRTKSEPVSKFADEPVRVEPVTIPSPDPTPNAHQAGYGQRRRETRLDLAALAVAASDRLHKSLQLWGLDAPWRDLAESDTSAPRRTRTYNPLIKSQLLCQLS